MNESIICPEGVIMGCWESIGVVHYVGAELQMQPQHWPVIIFIKKIVSGPGPGPSGASLITNQAVTALPGQASQAAAASRSTQPSLDSCQLSAFIASSNPFPSRHCPVPCPGQAGAGGRNFGSGRVCVHSSSLPTVGWAVSET